MSRLGVVAALAAEARALGSARPGPASLLTLADGSLLAVSGMGLGAAAAGAASLVIAGCPALLSFGLAGGLAPALRAGALLLPRFVLGAAGQRVPTDEAWRARLTAQLAAVGVVEQGDLYTSAEPLASVADKARLRAATGAAAVDMESVAVAGVAAQHGLPFVCVRVVVDTAGDELPGAVAAASRGGALKVGRLLAGLARRPADIGALLRLAARYRMAMRVSAALHAQAHSRHKGAADRCAEARWQPGGRAPGSATSRALKAGRLLSQAAMIPAHGRTLRPRIAEQRRRHC